MTYRRRVRSLEERSRRLHGRLTPQMICDARDRYFETGELPEDNPELAEMAKKIVEAARAMWATVPGPPWESDLEELLNHPADDDSGFEIALDELLKKYPESAMYLDDYGFGPTGPEP